MPRYFFALWVLLFGSAACGGAPPDRVTVFAAASLTDVMTDVAAAWEAEGGVPIRFSFAASSTLARQVEAGAPADLLALADREWMDYLDERGDVLAGTRIRPIGNRLVLIAPGSGAPAADTEAFAEALRLPGDGRLAIGDPSHVPVGRYARQALERVGRWSEFESRLAVADNARAVLALVERGDAPLGIVYATDARISERVRVVAPIPDGLHEPIVYEVAVAAGRVRPEVEALLAFLQGAVADRIYRAAGFIVPETS